MAALVHRYHPEPGGDQWLNHEAVGLAEVAHPRRAENERTAEPASSCAPGLPRASTRKPGASCACTTHYGS